MSSASAHSTAPVSGSLAPSNVSTAQPTCSKNQCSRTTIKAALAAVGIAVYLVGRYGLHIPFAQCRWLLIAVLVLGGSPLLIGLTRKLFAGEFGSDLLAGISIVTSALLGEYLAGSIVVLMLSGGTALEEYAAVEPRPFWEHSQRECRVSRTESGAISCWTSMFPKFKSASTSWCFPMRCAPPMVLSLRVAVRWMSHTSPENRF